MQFLAYASSVECPVCGTNLTVIKEFDRRLASMKHEGKSTCRFYLHQFRVDRISGYAEEGNDREKSSEVPVSQAGIIA